MPRKVEEKTTLITYMMHLEVETTSVAHGLPIVVAPPQRGHVRFTVGTRRARSSGRRLQPKIRRINIIIYTTSFVRNTDNTIIIIIDQMFYYIARR